MKWLNEHKIVCCLPFVVLQSHTAELLHSLPLACTYIHNSPIRKQKRRGKDTIQLLKSHSFSFNLISSECDFYYVYMQTIRMKGIKAMQLNMQKRQQQNDIQWKCNTIYIRILLKNKTLFLFQYIAQQHQNSFCLLPLPFRSLLHSSSSITYLLEMFLLSEFGGRMMSSQHY